MFYVYIGVSKLKYFIFTYLIKVFYCNFSV